MPQTRNTCGRITTNIRWRLAFGKDRNLKEEMKKYVAQGLRREEMWDYLNSTFPLAVYWYLEYLYESRIMPSILRLDKGNETVTIATTHAFLRQSQGDMQMRSVLKSGMGPL